MATTIHALKFMATFDTAKLEKGMVLTRSEFSKAKQITDKYKTSTERLNETHARLQRLVSAGKISMSQANAEMREAIATTNKLARSQTMLGKARAAVFSRGAGVVAGVGGAAAAVLSVTKIASEVGEQIQTVDRLNDMATKLSLPIEQLQRLGWAAKVSAGMSIESTASSLESMNRKVSDAARGVSKAKAIFDGLGLSVSQLQGLSMEDKFAAIGDAIRGVANEGDRLAFVERIFGNSDMGVVLSNSNEQLAIMKNRFEQLGGVRSALDAGKLAAAADAWDEAGVAWAKITGDMAVTVAPLMTEAVELLRRDEDSAFQDMVFGLGRMIQDPSIQSMQDAVGRRQENRAFGALNAGKGLARVPASITKGRTLEQMQAELNAMPNIGPQIAAQREEERLKLERQNAENLRRTAESAAETAKYAAINAAKREEWENMGREKPSVRIMPRGM